MPSCLFAHQVSQRASILKSISKSSYIWAGCSCASGCAWGFGGSICGRLERSCLVCTRCGALRCPTLSKYPRRRGDERDPRHTRVAESHCPSFESGNIFFHWHTVFPTDVFGLLGARHALKLATHYARTLICQELRGCGKKASSCTVETEFNFFPTFFQLLLL